MDRPSHTVLIVDAIPANREQYRLLLLQHRHFYTILEASSGMQGLNLWQQEQPDVILLGSPLPDQDDQVFLSQLQCLTQRSSLPVILIINQDSEEVAAQAIEAGVQTYVLKEQLNAQTLRIAIDSTITNSRLQQQLQQSEQRYAALAKISPVGIFRTDTNGDCLYTNDRWCELAGLTPVEAKGKGWLDALHPEDCDRVCAEWYHAAELNLPFRSEYRFQTPNGGVSWLIGQAIAERDSEGNLIGYVGTVTDITTRKQIEKALQESEKQFRQLAENIDAVFWIRDAVAQRVCYVSPAYGRLWRLNLQELYEDPQAWVNYIHPDDRASTDQAFWEKAPSGQFDQEYRIVLPDGHVRWVHDRCFPLRSETGEIERFTGIAEDITDRKQIEEMLRLQAQVLDQTHDSVVSTDLDGFITSWNQGAERILGYRAEEVLGQHISLLYGLETPDFLQNQVIAPLKAKGAHEVEVVAQGKQGNAIHLLLSLSLLRDESEHPVGIIGFSMNITGRKRAEAALRENEQLLRLALMGAQAGSWDWEIATGKITWSPENYALYGLDPAIGSPQYEDWSNALHPDDREWVNREVLLVVEQRLPEFRVEFRVVHPQQGERWLLGLGRLTLDRQGNPLRLSGINLDITDRKQAEAALQLKSQEAEEGRRILDALMEYVPEGITIADAPDVTIRRVSRYGQQLTGRAPDVIEGIPVEEHASKWDIFYEDGITPATGDVLPLTRAVQRGEVVTNEEWVLLRQDGTKVIISCNPGPIYMNGKIAGGVIAWRDVTQRKQAEQRLQESEQKLSLFVKYAPVSVAMFDRNMHYLAVSQRWIDEYHLGSIESVLGRSHYEIFPSVIPDHWRQAHQRGLAGTIEKCDEDRFVLADGSLQWLRWELHPWYTSTGEVGGIVIFAENITQRKQTEVALRENAQMLRLALTGAGQGIWDWNLETEVLTWDARCKEIFGLPPDFPTTYEWHLEALHPDDRQRVQAAANIALNEHTEFIEEYRTFHPNGTMHWILARGCGFYDATGKPYRMSGTVMDITARKQAEIDLQERNHHIRLLYETTRDLLSTDQPLTLIQSIFEDLKALIGLDVYFNYILDKQQQKLHLVTYGGIPIEQAKEIEWLDPGVAICGTAAQQRRQIMQANLQQSTDPKAELVRSLGLTAYCAQPLIAQDKLYGTLSFGSRSRQEFTPSEQNLFQAICDQMAIALERSELFYSLQQQTEELIRANRVKDEFLAVLSHELRSPLNPILGWAKLLQTRTFDATRTADALATIERNAKLQTQLIDDLLDVAKILRGKLSLEIAPVDLVFVIESAIDTVRAAAIAKNIHLHPILPQIGRVSGDATRLQQVVWNLLSNAIKFTPINGRVEIRLECVENQAQITVSDTGKGIKPDFLPYIFESFRQEDATTTRQYGGLGLGLSIVRHLVEAHGGTIQAESPGEGQGATFMVRLPLLELEPNRRRSEKLPEQELDLTGVQVLAVDDEPDARELLSVLLSQYGAEVLTVDSAAEVLVSLESFQPDVLISDIGMPNMDGFALIQQIRALPPERGGHIPAIALTAYARQEDYQQAIANGYQHHVTKPLDPEQLVRVVMTLMD